MMDATASTAQPAQERWSPAVKTRRLHPAPVRLMHWTNAVAMLVMITSGWGIYDDSVIIHGLHFSPALRLGSWAPESLLWHFAGMWLLAINGLAYLTYGVVTGRLRERLLPIRVPDLVQTVRDTLHFHVSHEDLTVYNAVQKVLYIVVILAGVSQVVTGLAIWKPVQFAGLVALMGGFQDARLLHFLGMSVIVGFLVVHVALSLLVPQTLWAMLTGGPRVSPRPRGRVLPEARGGFVPEARESSVPEARESSVPEAREGSVPEVRNWLLPRALDEGLPEDLSEGGLRIAPAGIAPVAVPGAAASSLAPSAAGRSVASSVIAPVAVLHTAAPVVVPRHAAPAAVPDAATQAAVPGIAGPGVIASEVTPAVKPNEAAPGVVPSAP